MKGLILTFATLAALCISSRAQEASPSLPLDEETKLITYREVVPVSGTKSELYSRAMEWVNKNYKNPADVTRVRNPEGGVIALLHRIELTMTEKGVNKLAGIVDYSLKIECKDGRYRYTIDNFALKQATRVPLEKWLDKSDKTYNPMYETYLSQVDAYTRKLAESLKQGMQPPAEKKADEW